MGRLLFMEAPRLEIGTWPTPLRRMHNVSEHLGRDVWVKVEEGCGAWGGNKVRKLEYILAAARRDRVTALVSYGAGTSNWTAALAHHGRAHGFEVIVGTAGPIPPSYSALYEDTGTRVMAWKGVNSLPLAIASARFRAGTRARSIPMGGSGYGDIGCVHVGAEIAAGISADALPAPAMVFVAVGTAGTAAGTAVGLALAGKNIPVVGVQVAPWPFGTADRVERHARRVLERLDTEAPLNVIGDARFLKPGYARPNPASIEAIEIARLDGLTLDGTYAAKAFAAVVDTARSQRGDPLLFIHTSPGAPPQ